MNTQTPEVPPVLTAWDPEAVAAYLSISVRQLSYLRQEDETFPQPRMIGRLPRWAPHVIVRWLAREPEPTTEPVASKPSRKAGQHVR